MFLDVCPFLFLMTFSCFVSLLAGVYSDELLQDCQVRRFEEKLQAANPRPNVWKLPQEQTQARWGFVDNSSICFCVLFLYCSFISWLFCSHRCFSGSKRGKHARHLFCEASLPDGVKDCVPCPDMRSYPQVFKVRETSHSMLPNTRDSKTCKFLSCEPHHHLALLCATSSHSCLCFICV